MPQHKTFEFGESDFSAVNEAILSEQEKAAWVLKDYRQRWWERWSKTVMFLCCALSLLIVAGSIAYWLINYEYPTQAVVAYAKGQGGAAFPSWEVEQEALEELDSNIYAQATVDTSFVVFYNAVTEEGETIVTGRKFEPTDLSLPVKQYCYKAIRGEDATTAIDIAEHSNGLTNVKTNDPALRALVEPHCNFTWDG